nr:thioredoxin f2, chloroplastic [Quercus suber]
MALNLSLSAPPIRSPQQPLLHYSAKHTIAVSSDRVSYPKSSVSRRVVTRVRSSLAVKVGQVTEVDKDTFWPLVKAADDKTVVLDMYTQWTGKEDPNVSGGAATGVVGLGAMKEVESGWEESRLANFEVEEGDVGRFES